MVFQSKGSDGLLTEIADTLDEVRKYCAQMLAEDEYRLNKIIQVNTFSLVTKEYYLKLRNRELIVEEFDELPF